MATRILIADNDETSLTGLDTLLTDLGYEVTLARTLDEAVAAAAREAPAVAIVALSLAADDPEALARPLLAASRPGSAQGAIPAAPHVPMLIAISGWGESRHRDAALAAGFDVHLVRPVGLDQLTLILSMTGL
ncbi:response regulator [Paraburkholderia acidisoli]|uniref:Response regulator n=1 Tax=Paraburkholderia acidisoli TaxID=2571748 RepID=A0A7Z2JES6_9BURK|nr:response regulator [Paraburkholderia acidisoli]QGZ62602.1 response regulator [Paraburkholderia acidisoli]